MNTDMPLRSKDLARLAGTTTRALRHYHQIGLLAEPPRDSNGYRRYSASDLVWVLRIRQFVDSGVPLRHVAGVLANEAADDTVLDELDRELERKAARIAAQRETLAQLRQRYSRARSATRQLDEQLWTLLRADHPDPEVLEGFEAVAAATESDAGGWYADFEELETATDISDESAQRLVSKMVEFYRRLDIAGEAGGEFESLKLAPELVRQQLSPAQYRVWRLFLAAVDAE